MALAIDFHWVVDVRCISLEQSDTMTGVGLNTVGAAILAVDAVEEDHASFGR